MQTDKVYKCEIINIVELTPLEKLFHIKILDPVEKESFFFRPGQFVMLEVPGFGEFPISISSSAGNKEFIELCIRKAGRGIGAVEVPRGILYHDFKIDKKGKILKANCIIPTTQNNANIHYDLKELIEQQVKRKKSDKDIIRLSEMLVRAYDPCISCSVH
ncbi:MAG: hypothetical protein GTO51_06955 [Candidatus Latescibacteria bacterium]|nr:hypothetical protein [Candidatus Latescibacterota bacterium]NIM21539.1 hypothetical protein [Candidatus Latescibacterota bacterium]NIM65710.1 hypothetical protein [Candidatus Latescibacterota bacterium]NIO02092.1 hypothetical protein [Candidatus Latescibacterota bacterium]NIO28904.1 hypothetical protein [Candidatus Latescibacterota bacterium]